MALILAELPAASASAQSFTVLDNFNSTIVADGSSPTGPLIQGPDGALYGTTSAGGSIGYGTVFSVQPDGSAFTLLKSFTGSDGGNPSAGLVLSGGTLYGTTISGGTNNWGTVFSVNTDGSGFTNLYTFSQPSAEPYRGVAHYLSSDGANPECTLVLSEGRLYGTTSQAGTNGFGTVFALNTNGDAFKTLYSFTGGNDCGNPVAGLILSGSTLYGTTSGESALIADGGTVFKINTNGGGYSTLHTFASSGGGYNPFGGLVLSGNTLYGTTYDGGGYNYGTVFSITTSGGSFTDLAGLKFPVQFDYPQCSLALLNGVLYGTATEGGDSDGNVVNKGTIFSVNVNGSGFKTIYTFTNGLDGATPTSGLLVSGDTLYGTASAGGLTGIGVLFKFNAGGSGFTPFYEFGDAPNPGSTPKSGLLLANGILYGTTFKGGNSSVSAILGNGAVFAVRPDGSGLATLHRFIGPPYDGSNPYGGLGLSGGVLFGTTTVGGANNNGTVFALSSDGSGYTNLHDFGALNNYYNTNSDGANPYGTLTVSGDTVYGTTEAGGDYSYGAVFKINTNGSGFTNLHSFAGSTNDGANPYAGLALAGGVLYGATESGGTNGSGMLFSLNTDGSGFTNLHSFTATTFTYLPDATTAVYTNGDGAYPDGALIASGSTLYGSTRAGGPVGVGVIFKLNTDGSGFTVLHSFTEAVYGVNSDGAQPYGALILSGQTLYGTTSEGGATSGGVIFSLNTDGSGFTNLYTLGPLGSFTDGATPLGGLALSGGVLYGTASILGGSYGGTIFSFGPPRLAVTQSGPNLVLAWPTNGAAFILQSTSELGPAAVWNPVTPPPSVVNSQFMFSNSTVGGGQFFRLQQQ